MGRCVTHECRFLVRPEVTGPPGAEVIRDGVSHPVWVLKTEPGPRKSRTGAFPLSFSLGSVCLILPPPLSPTLLLS